MEVRKILAIKSFWKIPTRVFRTLLKLHHIFILDFPEDFHSSDSVVNKFFASFKMKNHFLGHFLLSFCEFPCRLKHENERSLPIKLFLYRSG